MATYTKQLKDKDGNIIYPDVGIPLGDAVFSDDPTEITQPTGWVTSNDLADNSVSSDKLQGGSVTYAKIDRNSVDVSEVIYEYKHTGSVESKYFDVPIGMSISRVYKKITIEGYFVDKVWDTVRAIAFDSGGNRINCYEFGWEIWNGSGATIARSNNEMLAFALGDPTLPYYAPGSMKMEIYLDGTITDNVPTYHAESFGCPPNATNAFLQHFMGRVMSASANISYIRIGTFQSLMAGSWIKVSGVRK